MARLDGIIVSFDRQKGYGFIEIDDEGSSYFFHHSAINNYKGEELQGRFVTFDSVPSAKGRDKAVNVALLDQKTLPYQIPDNMPCTRHSSIKGWDVIGESGCILSAEDRAPYVAKDILREMASSFGATGLINYTSTRRTESEGNYNYTMHGCSAQPVIIARRHRAGHWTRQELDDRLPALIAGIEAYNKAVEEEKRKRAAELDAAIKRAMTVIFLGILAFIILVTLKDYFD